MTLPDIKYPLCMKNNACSIIMALLSGIWHSVSFVVNEERATEK